MAESKESTSTSDSTDKQLEKALKVQAEVRNKRQAEDELLNATTDDGVIAAVDRYNEIV